MGRGRWWIGVVCSAVVLAGCGQSEEERIRDLVAEYHDALDQRDTKRTCELLGPRAHANARGGCRYYVNGRFAVFGEVDLSELEAAAESASISVSGDRATVVLGRFDIASVRVGGDWKIESNAPASPAATPTAVPWWESRRRIRADLAQFYPAFERTRTRADELDLPASALSDLRRRGYTPHLN